jgi:hypothetical protein
MKKYLLLLSSAVVLFTFSSCDKDDPKPDPILGKWEFKFLKIQVLNNPQAADSLDGNITAIYLTNGSAQRIQLEVKNDKTFEEKYYLVNGSSDSAKGEWKKGTDSFTMTYDDDASEFNYSIQKNDENDLELVSTDLTSYTTQDQNGQNVTFDIKATNYYEK